MQNTDPNSLNSSRSSSWPLIKAAYLRREGSLRLLAERFRVSLNTLEKRCCREQWRRQLAVLDGKVAEAAADAAVVEGRKLGLTAAMLVERTIREAEQFLDRVQCLGNIENLTPDQLRTLISIWQTAIATARKAFRLDEEPEATPMISFVQLRRLHIDEPQRLQEPSCGTDGLDGPEQV